MVCQRRQSQDQARLQTRGFRILGPCGIARPIPCDGQARAWNGLAYLPLTNQNLHHRLLGRLVNCVQCPFTNVVADCRQPVSLTAAGSDPLYMRMDHDLRTNRQVAQGGQILQDVFTGCKSGEFGRIQSNGQPAMASREVRVGDLLQVKNDCCR
jgi:hypothetical protein